jgi:crotonobetainyl-CoA:carnitine CoA-transferase CaiB-like acyl-CoA transferase
MDNAQHPGPLSGMRVLELGQLLAGPFVGCILGYYGAEVIKVESPGGGDPLRTWRVLDEGGTSYWWRSLARNKKCITANLRSEEGRDLVRQIADRSDILVENFRPGVMEKWGLGPEDMKATNPGLIYARISGYGQDGPYASKPGFASVCEGVGGLRYVNGFPDEAPVRANLSLGDSLAGLHATLGIVMACLHRERQSSSDGDEYGKAAGQIVDTALYESVFNMMEAVIPEYSAAGVVRQPSGSTLTGIVPTNTYRCADGKFVIIGANGNSIFKRLCKAIGRPDMATDSRLAENAGRVEHEAQIDEAINNWISVLDSGRAVAILEDFHVPAGPIYNAADMLADEHFRARGLFEEVEVNGRKLKIPALMPKLSATPGETRWAGSELGAFNREIYGDLLGLSDARLAQLADQDII